MTTTRRPPGLRMRRTSTSPRALSHQWSKESNAKTRSAVESSTGMFSAEPSRNSTRAPWGCEATRSLAISTMRGTGSMPMSTPQVTLAAACRKAEPVPQPTSTMTVSGSRSSDSTARRFVACSPWLRAYHSTVRRSTHSSAGGRRSSGEAGLGAKMLRAKVGRTAVRPVAPTVMVVLLEVPAVPTMLSMRSVETQFKVPPRCSCPRAGSAADRSASPAVMVVLRCQRSTLRCSGVPSFTLGV